MGFTDRGRPQHREVAPAVAGVEAAHRPGALPRPEEARARPGEGRPQMVREGLIDPDHYCGTINCDGVNAKGEVCGVTTTSGLAWKIPGRVGDSPILGAGLWVDGEVGAAGSTGRGEANLFNLSSFLIVEEMRARQAPQGRGHGGAAAHQGQHRREAAAQRARATRTSGSASTCSTRRASTPASRCTDGLRRVHREGPGDAAIASRCSRARPPMMRELKEGGRSPAALADWNGPEVDLAAVDVEFLLRPSCRPCRRRATRCACRASAPCSVSASASG